MNERLEITIGMPIYDAVAGETFMSFHSMIMEMLARLEKGKFGYNLITVKGMPVDKARNKIVHNFLKEKNSQYLLFIDSDMIIPKDLFERLLKIDADISSGLAYRKWYPHFPVIYKREERGYKPIINYPKNQIIEVDAIGMSCCLIKRKVFEEIKYPWYEFKELRRGEFLGEDFTFCQKAREKGFVIKVDTGLLIGHVGGIVSNETFEGVKALHPIVDIETIKKRMGKKFKPERKKFESADRVKIVDSE